MENSVQSRQGVPRLPGLADELIEGAGPYRTVVMPGLDLPRRSEAPASRRQVRHPFRNAGDCRDRQGMDGRPGDVSKRRFCAR
jgi:hypothetical protein